MTTVSASELNSEYKHHCFDVNNVLAYRDTGGDGPVLLFLHDFASFSYSWNDMLLHMPEGFRYIRVDLNGFGFSLRNSEDLLTSFDQAELLRNFILTLDLHRLTLVGQGLGGEIAILLAHSPEILARMDRMVLISSSGLLDEIPEYIGNIATFAAGKVLQFAHSRLLAKMMLDYAYRSPAKIREKTLEAYSAMLNHPGRLDTIIRAAEEYKLPDQETVTEVLKSFELPVLLVWGAEDTAIPPENMCRFSGLLRNAAEIIIPDCGHLPQEECPEIMADLIADFIHRKKPRLPDSEFEKQILPEEKKRKLRMSSLFDKWSIGSIGLIFILKTLQFFRLLGVRAEAHGWRKVTSIFLRGEYSKFVLASFRLNYSAGAYPEKLADAKQILLKRLYVFLLAKKELHWSVEPGLLSFNRRKIPLCDIVEAEIDGVGNLKKMIPALDERHSRQINLTDAQIAVALENIMRICNQYKDAPGKKRPQLIQQALHKWSGNAKGFSFLSRRNLYLFIERIMTSSFIYFYVLPENRANCERRRMATPDIRVCRHPGWGMICISARFTSNFREADLWFQFHHITADGAPMQEILTSLKQEWGAMGEVFYPSLKYPVTLAETMDCGDDIFRTRLYIDFTRILKLRKWLNDHYFMRMNGAASLAGLLLWGLAGHEAFRDKKMLLPVDAGVSLSGERELGLLFIRPGNYRQDSAPLEGFLNFQKEMNRRMNDVRLGRSESHEFLSLCTMLHPFFYHLASLLAPQDLHEIVGSMGLSIIRDAEMFISPLTDFQSNGFVSLGSVKIHTENGLYAGSLCICGHRHHIKNYLQAVKFFVLHFPEAMGLPPDWETTK